MSRSSSNPFYPRRNLDTPRLEGSLDASSPVGSWPSKSCDPHQSLDGSLDARRVTAGSRISGPPCLAEPRSLDASRLAHIIIDYRHPFFFIALYHGPRRAWKHSEKRRDWPPSFLVLLGDLTSGPSRAGFQGLSSRRCWGLTWCALRPVYRWHWYPSASCSSCRYVRKVPYPLRGVCGRLICGTTCHTFQT